MQNKLLIPAFLALSSVLAPLRAAVAVMTNQTIQGMVSSGVPLPEIIKAIKTARKIELYINERELAGLKNAGASASQADEIFKAIHYREYVGIDQSLVAPEERVEPSVSGPNLAPPPPARIPSVPASFAPAAEDLLTDTEVNQAILMGMAAGQHRIGLVLNDPDAEYTVHLYTAKQWIEQLVANARSEMQPFSAADVTPEMRRKMLHVAAMPSTPEDLNDSGFILDPSVQQIAITDTTGAVIVQPTQLDTATVTANSAFRSAELSHASAAFMMCDVDKLRASDSRGEFFIAVTCSGQTRFFRVKERS